MAYSRVYPHRTNWENYPSTDTPVNEENLNEIDYAVFEHDKRIIELEGRILGQEENLTDIANKASESATDARNSANLAEQFVENASDEADRAYNEAERARLYADTVQDGITTTTSRTLTESYLGGLKINSIEGESQQIQYSGKNKYDEVSLNRAFSYSGITATKNATGQLSFSGTSTASINEILGTFTLPAGTYYISSGTHGGVSARLYNRTSSAFILTDKGSFTLGTESTLDIRIQISTGVAVSGTLQIQIEEGSIATPFEPFVGNQPSPNPNYPQDINSVEISEIWTESKNIVTEESVSTTYSAYITTENQWRYSTDSKSVRVKARPNITYTVSISETVSLFRVGCINSERYPSTDGEAFILTNVVRNTSNAPITITTSEDTQYIVVQVPMATKTDTLQIEKGDVATPYQKHFQTKETLSAPITLRGIGDVKDNVVKKDGVYDTSRKQGYALFDGSVDEEWVLEGTVVNNVSLKRFKITVPNGNNSASRTFCLCNRSIFSADVTSGVGSCFIHTSMFWIYVDQTIDTLEKFRTWLASNNIEVVYPLATPTFEPLPLADQISLHKLESFGGVTYLFTDSTIEPIIEVEYGTSKVGGYALGGYQKSEANRLLLEQLNTLTNEMATQLVAGSEV